jgi:hypothetical protein
MVGRAGTPATRGCEPRQARKGAAAAAQRVLGRGRYGPPPLNDQGSLGRAPPESQGQGAYPVWRTGDAAEDPGPGRFIHEL